MEGKKKVLLVDDEPDFVHVLKKKLTIQKYDVYTADNGPQGIALAKSIQPDIIILDVAMPEMDGGSVAAQLKKCSETSTIPIIFLTALISKDEEMLYQRCVANNTMLPKSVHVNKLITLIEEMTQAKCC
jgi:DNA-binding response OmpR family regulator